MNRILTTYATTAAAVLAIALAFVGNVSAQEEESAGQQSEQEQSKDQQAEEQKSESQQDEQQKSQDQQKQQQAQEKQKQQQSTQDEQKQNATQSESQSGQQNEQQRTERQQQRRQQADRQRGREEQWRDSGQSSQSRWNEPRESRWPQPDGIHYGSDSLQYRGEQRNQSQSGSKQGGLGVILTSDGRGGVVVAEVHPDSPAEEMGIRERDRITQVNGREVQSVQQFIARIRNMDPGEDIELDIRRGSGGERTVRGELESRIEALASSGDERGWSPQREDRFDDQQDRNRQTSYEENRRTSTSSQRGGQMSGNRIEEIERQVNRLSRELDQLRYTLRDLRRQSASDQSGQERTASYDEYQSSNDPRRTRQGRGDAGQQSDRYESSQRTSESGQESDRFESADEERESTRTGSGSDASESRDSYDEGPGGEIGDDRQRVGSENIDRD